MRYLIAVFMSFLLVAAAGAATVEVDDVELPRQATARDGSALTLNGAGLRKRFFFSIYVGALYLAEPLGEAEAIRASDQPARMEMHFRYGEIERERLNEAWREGLEANNEAAALADLEPRIERFLGMTPAVVDEGDVVTYEYLPGDGTRVAFNGEAVGTVEGHDFFAALVGVWIGPEPPSGRLSEGVLGN